MARHYDKDGYYVGRSESHIDPWGNESKYHYDSDGNVTGRSERHTDLWSNNSTYHYDTDGNETGRTDHDDDDGDSGGGCYLTTACVEYKQLADDCDLLTQLRHFRDTYMREDERMQRDVQQYYAVAPQIVSAIRSSSSAAQEQSFAYIYGVIVQCVGLIKQRKFEECYAQYKTMVAKLSTLIRP